MYMSRPHRLPKVGAKRMRELRYCVHLPLQVRRRQTAIDEELS